MAIIIETCPKCGHDLHDLVIATNPPVPQKKCFGCGWEWTGEPEQVVRVSFGGNSFNHDNLTLHGSLGTSITACGDNAINTGELLDALTKAFEKSYKEYEDKFKQESLMGNFEQPACANCPNNIKNGGSGICFCTLGQQAIY